MVAILVLQISLKHWRVCKRMEGAAWKGSGGTLIALRKLRSSRATLADPIFRPEIEIYEREASSYYRDQSIFA